MEIRNGWIDLLQEEFQKPYFLSLMEFLEEEYQTKVIYPSEG